MWDKVDLEMPNRSFKEYKNIKCNDELTNLKI